MAPRFCHCHGLAHQFLRTSEQGVNRYMQGGVRRIVSQMRFPYWVAFSKWKTRREEGSYRYRGYHTATRKILSAQYTPNPQTAHTISYHYQPVCSSCGALQPQGVAIPLRVKREPFGTRNWETRGSSSFRRGGNAHCSRCRPNAKKARAARNYRGDTETVPAACVSCSKLSRGACGCGCPARDTYLRE